MRKLMFFILTLCFALIPFSRVMASPSMLSVRLSQPKTPTNQTSIPLVFVALDLGNHPVTVKCMKKGPSDTSYSQFGSDISLLNGGNTGTCDVTSSIISANGVYTFQALATNGTDNASSEEISLNFATGGPGDPTDYSKDHISSCQYKIHFKTADDGGKTVRVDIYRSEQTSFAANNGSRVTMISASSNESHDYVDNVTCDKTYYYVIRAFDAFGNGSGLVGDSIANVTYTTTTTTVTATSVTTTQGTTAETAQGGAVEVPGGAGLSEEGAGGGAILGETTPAPEHVTLSEPGQVKGAQTSLLRKILYTVCVILLIILVVLWYVLRKKTQTP